MSDKEQLISTEFLLVRLLALTGKKKLVQERLDSEELSAIGSFLFSEDYREIVPQSVLLPLTRLCDIASQHYDDCYMKSRSKFSQVPPILSGNRAVYAAVHDILEAHEKLSEYYPELIKLNTQVSESSEISNQVRNLYKETQKRKAGAIFMSSADRDFFISMHSVADALDEERDDALKSVKQFRKEENDSDFFRKKTPLTPTEKWSQFVNDYSPRFNSGPLKTYLLGPIVIVRVLKSVHIMSRNHLQRLTHTVRSMANLSVASVSINLRAGTEEVVKAMSDLITQQAMDRPDFVGECFKAARQAMIIGLDRDPIMSDKPVDAFMSSLAPERKRWAARYMQMLLRQTHSRVDSINLANFYRCLPHPDCDMSKCFNTILGFKDRNTMDSRLDGRVRGTAMRTLYRSLKSIGHDVRLKTDSDDPDAVSIVELSKRSHVDVSNMIGKSYNTWSKVSFELCRSLPHVEDLIVKPSDKASASEGPGSLEDLEELKEWSTTLSENVPDSFSSYRTINDIRSVIDGTDNLNAKKAVKKFARIMKRHEEFEQKYMKDFNVCDIDEIPSSVLEAFLHANSDARYLVSTEPKLGEFHKEVTRMFYIGEQALKAITQRVERIARMVSRKQSGVSIVKGYAAKRRDLEKFCHAMTGKTTTNNAVFVSFDLSEFSKKFPQRLVRMYGSILSDLTGEKWLSRIDLIFRASLVLHNTRGFFDYTAGVLGGFEGFLNFVWSSIHAIIMEISLDSLGVRGELLTYSDDGLLYFVTPSTNTNTQTKGLVLKIRDTYKRFGLVFHVVKTFVSYNIWEYLGDVCYKSHLIPMSVKEVCSFGRNIRSKGLLLFSDSLERLVGQARSLVKSGFSPNASYYIMRFFCAKRLFRFNNRISHEIMESLFITPVSCGGLRIPSSIELMASTSIDRDSEFLADLGLYIESNKYISILSTTVVTRFMAKPEKAIDAIVLGTRYKTSGIRTSGMSVAAAMLEEIIEKSSMKVMKNPITKEKKSKLSRVLKHVENLDPSLVNLFITSLTTWSEYNDSLSVVKSKAAISALGYGRIKYYQHMDTKNVHEALTCWLDSASELSYSQFSVGSMMDRSEKVFMKGYHFKPMKPSARLVLRLSPACSETSIACVASIDRTLTNSNQEFKEPCVAFSTGVSSIRWLSEASSVSEISSARKMFDTMASLISYNPDTNVLFRSLGGIFDVAIPDVPAGIRANPARRSVSANKPSDVSLFMPTYFQSLSTVRYCGKTRQFVYSMSGLDKKTYLELARAMSSIYEDARYSVKCPRKELVSRYYYTIPDQLVSQAHYVPQMKLDSDVPIILPRKLADPQLSNEFIASVQEHQNTQRDVERFSQTDYSTMSRDSEEYIYYTEVRRMAIVDWMRRAITLQRTPIVESRHISISLIERIDDLSYGVIIASYLTLNRELRKLVSQSVIGYSLDEEVKAERKAKFSEQKREEPPPYRRPKDRIDVRSSRLAQAQTEAMIHYMKNVNLLIDSLGSLEIPEYSPDMLRHLREYSESEFSELKTYITGRTFLSKKALIIMKSGDTAPGKFSPEFRAAFNQAFTNTLTEVYTISAHLHWNIDAIKRRLPGVRNVDQLLDFLTINRPLLRESDHRSPHHPFNRTSSEINSLKFYMIIERELKALRRILTGDETEEEAEMMYDLVDFSVSNSISMRIEKNFRELGPDHRSLLTEDLDPSCHSRMMVKLRYFYKMELEFKAPGLDLLRHSNHEMYQLIIAPFTRRVVEMSSEVKEMVENSFSNEDPFELLLADAPAEVNKFTGELCDDEFYQSHPGVVSLIGKMLDRHLLKCGIPSITKGNDQSHTCTSVLLSMSSSSNTGPSLSSVECISDQEKTQVLVRDKTSACSYFIIRCRKKSSVITNLLILRREGCGERCVIKSGSDYYILHAGSSIIKEYITAEEYGPDDDISLDLDRIVSHRSLEYQLSRFSVNDDQKQDNRVSSAPLTSTYARVQSHSAGVRTKNPILATCVQLMQDFSSVNTRLSAYILLKAEILRQNTTMDFTEAVKQVGASVNRYRQLGRSTHVHDRNDYNALARDVTLVSQWIATSSVSIDISVHTEDIDAVKSLVKNVLAGRKALIEEQRILTTARPVSAHDLVNIELSDPDELLEDSLYPPQKLISERGESLIDYDEIEF